MGDNDTIATMNFVFQVWDFAISWFVPEFCTIIMMCHHALAGLVCFYSIHWQFLHYYGVFFLGLTEFSTIFLCVLDFSRFFPPSSSSGPYSLLVSIAGPFFVIMFFFFRVLLWWKVSYQLWLDVHSVVKSGSAKRYRPNKVYVLYVYLVSNLLLGGLQLYWFFYEIIPAVINAV